MKILSSNQIKIDKTKKNEISKILTLYSFRSFIKKIIRKPQKRPKDNYIYFENTLKKIQSLIMNNQINLHMVLLPDYELLIEKKNYSKTRYERVKKILNKNNIDFLDIYKNTFSKHKKSYKKFFSNKNSHYNSIGYKLVAEDVIIYLSKK